MLREGQARGSIEAGIDPAALAPVIQDLWTGALQRAAVTRTVTPLREALRYLKGVLTPATA